MKKIVLFLTLLLSVVVVQASILPGRDYVILSVPYNVQKNYRKTVLEFFSYHCGHCFELSKKMEVTKKKWPTGVQLKRIQVIWDEPFKALGRLLATLEKMNKIQVIHHRVFQAFLQEGVLIYDRSVLFDWMKRQRDIDANSFQKHYDSAAAKAMCSDYETLTQDFNVDRTPMVIVGGKYLVVNSSPDHMAQVTDELILRFIKKH